MQSKVQQLENLKKIRDLFKKEGKKVVFTNGCFDLIHKGHVHLLKEAKRHLDKLIKQQPKNPNNYHALAKVHYKFGDLESAENAISKASKYGKFKNFDALMLWGQILFELNRHKESLEAYELAQKIKSDDFQVLKNIKKI